jgi:hypothetical protein
VIERRDDGDYTPETRERAYLLWAWDCGQVIAAVSRRVDIPEPTLRYWARTDGWKLRYEQERADLSPVDARPVIALKVQHGAVSGAAYLAAVADGLVTEPSVEDIVQRTDISPIDKRLLIEARIKSFAAARKDRIVASKTLLDAAGFAAIKVTGDEHQSVPKVSVQERTDWAALPSGDLAAREKAMRSGN